MTRIFLIGYMGVGKTTTGKELAKYLNLEFVDLDHYIQNRYSKAISQIFEEEGESKFREIENKMLEEITSFDNVLISTGGGAPCFHNNMEIMNKMGLTIYLKASPRLLAERLETCKEKRPLIRDKSDKELEEFIAKSLIVREPFYSQAQIIFEFDELIDKYNPEKYLSKLIKEIEYYKS